MSMTSVELTSKENAARMIRRMLAAQDDARVAELTAMSAIAAVPGRSIILDGKRYVAVTSRDHVDVRPLRPRKKIANGPD